MIPYFREIIVLQILPMLNFAEKEWKLILSTLTVEKFFDFRL